MSASCSGELPGIPQVMSQSFDSPGLMYSPERKDSLKEKEKVQGKGYWLFSILYVRLPIVYPIKEHYFYHTKNELTI